MRTFAIGDPQAPFATFLAILRHHALLDGNDRLRGDVALISMGDHFDWGRAHERARAAADAVALVQWLASHPPEQVTLIIGNHDVARVGEMHGVDDAAFAAAQSLADRSYKQEGADADAARAALKRDHPQYTNDEVVARDFCTFRAEQRDLVRELLLQRRLRLAHAAHGKLFVHAGVTVDDLAEAGVAAGAVDVGAVAARLNRYCDDAVDAWHRAGERAPLHIGKLHVPGDAHEEGAGILYHRPSLALTPKEQREFARARPRRRFDPRRLPRGITQVIGHIRDNKCRELLGPGVGDAVEARDGLLRSLVVDDAGMRYRHGIQACAAASAARVIFTDGGMSSLQQSPERYEILDVAADAAADAC